MSNLTHATGLGLEGHLSPQLFETYFSEQPGLESARDELRALADGDPDGCYGFFPDFDAGNGLPRCQEFAAANQSLSVAGLELPFGFLRVTNRSQPNQAPYHLDGAEGSAFDPDLALYQLPDRIIYRAVVNLGDRPRRISYVSANPFVFDLEAVHGYAQCKDEIPDRLKRTAVLPPRDNAHAFGVLICVSQVLHAAVEDGPSEVVTFARKLS